jgi:hypothetical protein
MSAHDGLWTPDEPEWLAEAAADLTLFVLSLRESYPEVTTNHTEYTEAQRMADDIIARGEAGFTPAPEGQYLGVCVDAVDLGERLESFQGGTPKLTRKVAIVFQIAEDNPETGLPYELSVEKTLAFGQTAGLRKFLGQWRGKAYSDAEASAGVPLAKLVGVNAMLQVEHRQSVKGRTYANVGNIMPPPKGLPKIEPVDYQRSEHWTRRRTEYAEEVTKWRAGGSPPQASTATTRNGQPAKVADPDLTKSVAAGVLDDDSDGLPF